MSIFRKDIFGGDHSPVAASLVPSQQFEILVRRLLEREFSPEVFEFDENQERRVEDGSDDITIRPDLVITEREHTDGGRPVVCVADAKLRKRLSKATAERLVRYSRLLDQAIPTRAYVPEDCRLDAGATALEAAGMLTIVRVPGVFAGEDSPLDD